MPILSPGPRRYFQLKAEFNSEDLGAARALGALAFTVSNPPLTERIISEVVPRQVELGVPVSFTYAVLPTKMRSGVDLGFDVFEIATPVRSEEVETIEVVHADGEVQTADFTGVDLTKLPVQDDSGLFAVEAVTERHLRVRFPTITESDLAAGQAAVVKIRFKCRVLRLARPYWHCLEQRYRRPWPAGHRRQCGRSRGGGRRFNTHRGCRPERSSGKSAAGGWPPHDQRRGPTASL